MKTFNKIFSIIALVGVGTLGCGAQDFTFGVGVQGQLNTLDIDGVAQSSDLGFGSGAGVLVDVGLQLNDNWSIHSGVGYSMLRSRANIGRLAGSEAAVDREGEDFTFMFELSQYVEEQRFNNISIPLAIQYESSGNTRFYARAGGSYNLLTGSKQESRAGRLTTSGFFPRFNGTLTAPAFAGFGSYGEIEFEERDLDLENSINIILESGVKQMLNNGSSIYVGAFAEIGMSDISNDNPKRELLSYNAGNPLKFIGNGTFDSNTGGIAAVEEAKLLFVGIRLRYQFGSK
ncbi:MAG: outer membrane beta-barrel protein [Nonlabens sp.]